MPISSLSAVSLHICSHFIFRSLSRSSRITPGQQHRMKQRKKKTDKRESQARLTMCFGDEHAWVPQALPSTWYETLNSLSEISSLYGEY